jgi:hypothetical protein
LQAIFGIAARGQMPDSALMHCNMTFVHQSQALVQRCCGHLFP